MNLSIQRIKNRANDLKAKIITTEKDFVKISKIHQPDINFLEINLKIKNEEDLISFLKQKIL